MHSNLFVSAVRTSAPVLSSIPALENLHEMLANKTRFPRPHLVIWDFFFFLNGQLTYSKQQKQLSNIIKN